MSENELRYYPQLPTIQNATQSRAVADKSVAARARLEPATCTEAEPFALRVLDDSMQPEFRRGCIIVIDPTGRATDGSYVLADDGSKTEDETEGMVFRQLRRQPTEGWVLSALNEQYPDIQISDDLGGVIGVIVQRAGVRRSYHKRYD